MAKKTTKKKKVLTAAQARAGNKAGFDVSEVQASINAKLEQDKREAAVAAAPAQVPAPKPKKKTSPKKKSSSKKKSKKK